MIGYSIDDLERERERYEAEHQAPCVCNCDICGEPLYKGEYAQTAGDIRIVSYDDEYYAEGDGYIICDSCYSYYLYNDKKVKDNAKCSICNESHIIEENGENYMLGMIEIQDESFCENCFEHIEI